MITPQFDLRAHNTLKLASQAQAFARFSSVAELQALLRWAAAEQWPVKVLGAGSNVLLAEHIEALVVQSAMTTVEQLASTNESTLVAVEAGMNWHQWVLQSLDYGHGLENLALIPGTVGAAPVQNIGAYGVEVAELIEWVEGVQISTQQPLRLTTSECQFSYRNSIFKHALAGDFIITRVAFRLPHAFTPKLHYGPLQALDAASLTAKQLIEQVCRIRSSKLPDPQQIPNAGSFFKNPIVAAAQGEQLALDYPSLPHYPQPQQQMKLAAGWLIEQAGFKGQWHGNVRMHEAQALVLTTNGQASLEDVMALKNKIIKAVEKQFGVTLEPEPQLF